MANRLGIALAIGVFAWFMAPCVLAQASASPCKVLDTELQGPFRGPCANGLADGLGEAWGVAYYRGQFKAGRKHGQGTKVWVDTGDRYEGTFVEDRKEGHGVYTWGTGSMWANERYSGAYVDDQRHGQGTYIWPSGERYEGSWINDQPTGTLSPSMRARSNAYVAAVAAASRVGIRICQERLVGIGVRESIKGTVTIADGDAITVRIEDPGQMGHVMQGQNLLRGSVVQSRAHQWKPCL